MSRFSSFAGVLALTLITGLASAQAPSLARIEPPRATAVVSAQAPEPISLASVRVVAISSAGRSPVVVPVYEASDARLFLAVDDLALLALRMQEVLRLPQEQVGDCLRCIDIAALGEYQEDSASATAKLLAQAPYAAAQAFSLRERSAPGEPLPFVGLPGFYLNYDLLGSRLKTGDAAVQTGYGLIARPTFSLGQNGVVRTGVFLRDDGAPLTADTYWERQLPDWGGTLRVGDYRSTGDIFGGGTRITGVHWQKNFAFNAQQLAAPYYQYSFDTRAPGVVEIYRDGLLTDRQSYDPGTVTLQNLPSSAQGDVRLVVRDAVGGEQVIYLPLFGDSTFLPRGTSAYSGSLGALRRPKQLGGGVAAGQWRYGLTSWMNLEASGEASEELQRAGLNALFSSQVGRFQLAGASLRANGAMNHYGRADWRYSLAGGASRRWDFGASLLWVPTSATDNNTVYNAYASTSRGRLAASVAVSGADGQRGASAGLGYSFGNLSIAFAASVNDDRASEFGLRLVWTPRVRGSATRFGVSVRGDEASGARQVIADAGLIRRPYNVQAFAGRRLQEPTGTDWQLRGGYDGAALNAQGDAARVGEGQRQTLRASGAVILDDDGFFVSSSIPGNGGYAVVGTGVGGAVIEQDGRRYRANGKGYAAVPVAAYRNIRPSIDYASIPPDHWVEAQRDWGRVYPGQKARIEMGLAAGFLVVLPEETSDVTLNGRPLAPVGLFVQVDGAVPGENTLRVAGEAYRFRQGDGEALSGIYRVDRQRGGLVKEETQ